MSSFTANNSTNNNRKVLEFTDWNPKSHKYMVPKVNDKGGKSVSLISTQTSRSLHINTPLLMTWGISDFTNDDGTSDGKFKISLNLPSDEYKTEQTDNFLKKITDFQLQIIDDAVINSELWFGKKKSRELVEDSFFPFIKYPKLKDLNGKSTSTIDYNRPPSISAKVPCYHQDDGSSKWDCDLFNINYNQIFPCEDESITPQELVPKLSKIACTLQCTGIWIGGKGWGLTWKFISGVVKPRLQEPIRGTCHIRIDASELQDDNTLQPEMVIPPTILPPSLVKSKDPVSITIVDDSDEEAEAEPEEVQAVVEPEPEPEAEAEAEVQIVEPDVVKQPKIIKKIVKKKVVV